jgi:hypothetical protein
MKKDYIENLKEALNSIEFDVKGTYPNRFIYNNLNKRTNWRVLNDRIELSNDEVFGGQFKGTVCFFFKGSKIKKINKNFISIGTDSCFVAFENFDKEEK